MDSDSLAIFFLLILPAIGLELDIFYFYFFSYIVPVVWPGFLGFYLIQQILSLNVILWTSFKISLHYSVLFFLRS